MSDEIKRLPVCGVVYRSEMVANLERRFGSDTVYFPFYVVDSDGRPSRALATRDEINRMIARGAANQEDLGPPASGLRRLLAWWFR
jgi:hypothetical protein